MQKNGEISKIFQRWNLDVCALSEPKLKGKGEVRLGEDIGKVSGVGGGTTRQSVALVMSMWLLRCVMEWNEVSSRLIWVRVKIEGDSWVFILAIKPSSETSD